MAMTRAQCLLYLSCPLEEAGKGTKVSSFLSKAPMDSYLDQRGATLGHGVALELAKILRRPPPSRTAIEAALMTYSPLEDDIWPCNGRLYENEAGDDVEHADRINWRQHGLMSAASVTMKTTMQQKAAFSVAATTLGTGFTTASAALAIMQDSQDANATRMKTGQESTKRTIGVAGSKRKVDASGTAQGTLANFFSKPTKMQCAAHGADLSGLKESQRRAEPTVAILQDITNTAATDSLRCDEAIIEQSISKPAATFHTTSMTMLQQQTSTHRKTLGVRRTMDGWAARMQQSK